MKTDQEFLAGMWNKVEALEMEELRKQAARLKNRRETWTIIKLYSLGTLVSILLAVSFASLGLIVIMVLIFLLFCFGYAAEAFLDTSQDE